MRAAIAQIEIQEDSYGRYEGQVNQHGMYHGKGVLSWSNGDRYVGEFSEDNRRHGHGTLTLADGRVQSGQWENDRFLG